MRELANFAAAALVFGQFVGEGIVSWTTVVAGSALWFLAVSLGLIVEGE